MDEIHKVPNIEKNTILQMSKHRRRQTSQRSSSSTTSSRTSPFVANSPDQRAALHSFFSSGGRRRKRATTRRTNIIAGNIAKVDRFYIDYSLVKEPYISSDAMTFYCRGEVTPTGFERTPFAPASISNRDYDPSDKMMFVQMSDFTINSLLYHAARKGYLDIQVTPDTPEIGSLLRTSCFDLDASLDSLFCLGDLVPELQDAFPDEHKLRLDLFHRSAPAILFKPNGADAYIFGDMNVYTLGESGRESPRRILRVDVDVDAEVDVKLIDRGEHKITGGMRYKKLSMTVRQSNVPGLEKGNDLFDIAYWTEELTSELLNTFLADGIPLPKIRGATLKRPSLEMGRRTLTLSSDMVVDRNYVKRIISNEIGQRLNDLG